MNEIEMNFMKQEKLFVRWWDSKNWGDALNPVLIHMISGVDVTWCDYPRYIKLLNTFYSKWELVEKHQDMINPITMNLLLFGDYIFKKGYSSIHKFFTHKQGKSLTSQEVFLVIGSILHQVDRNAVIWGAGFISERSRLREKPKLICAVRGPLTRKTLLIQGLDCPEIYGDPALLYPRFYSPPKDKKYKLGIVPHFVDQNSCLLDQFRDKDDIVVIDVKGEINKFVDEINSCERIASSSLHGIIAADAYGIPSSWINFSNKIIGDGFKFRDYFTSVGRKTKLPLEISKIRSLHEVFAAFEDYELDIDLDKLLKACPFRNEYSLFETTQ